MVDESAGFVPSEKKNLINNKYWVIKIVIADFLRKSNTIFSQN